MARILAAAQYAAAADFPSNVERHLRYASAAASLGVQLLVFPELSLTGYQMEYAAENALSPHSVALEPLRAAARELRLTLLVGAPIANAGGKPSIGQLAILPDGLVVVHTKQHLAGAEFDHFQPGQGGPVLKIGPLLVASAICNDITHAEHAANAAAHRATIYAASVLLREQVYGVETGLLAGYARQHGMTVVMANHAAETGGWVPAGRSAIWDEQGALVAQSAGTEEALVLARRRGRNWEGAVFPLNQAVAAPRMAVAAAEAQAMAAPVAPAQGTLFG